MSKSGINFLQNHGLIEDDGKLMLNLAVRKSYLTSWWIVANCGFTNPMKITYYI